MVSEGDLLKIARKIATKRRIFIGGVHLLSEATLLMHKIASTHDIIFLLINIVTRRTETESGSGKCLV